MMSQATYDRLVDEYWDDFEDLIEPEEVVL